MLKKSKGNHFISRVSFFKAFPINFIICLTPYRKASITGAFFIKESEDNMGVRVVFPDMGKDPSVQLIEKTITENGTYDAITDGANGYSKVNVNVEGGGGESDFSTAEVTIPNEGGTTAQYVLPVIRNNVFGVVNVRRGDDEMTFNTVLYKGALVIHTGENIVISGSAEYDDGTELTTITGDCTLKGYVPY